MIDATLAISFGRESQEANVLIEQEPWDSNQGIVTKKNMFDHLRFLILPSIYETAVLTSCGIDANTKTLNTFVYAYPSEADLSFNIDTSYGVLNGGARDDYYTEEIVIFDLDFSNNLKYPIGEVLDYEWVGSVYDVQGNITNGPSVDFSSGEAVTENQKKVYGSLKVFYRTVRYIYSLTVRARENSQEDLFGAVVYATYNGGVSWLEIDIPAMADLIASGQQCGWITRTSEPGPDEFTPPDHAPSIKRTIRIDYCSQTVNSIETETL